MNTPFDDLGYPPNPIDDGPLALPTHAVLVGEILRGKVFGSRMGAREALSMASRQASAMRKEMKTRK